MRRAAAFALVVATMMVWSPAARPQPSRAEVKAATAKFKTAQKLFDARNFADALEAFRDVDKKLGGSPNSLLYIGRCLRELERLPEAYEALGAAMRVATERAKSDSAYVTTRDAAAAERAAVETKIGRLVIAVADPPEGIEVAIDDTAVPVDRLGETLPVPPGKVVVTARAPGRTGVRREVSVGAGESETVAITLVVPGSGDAPSPAPTPEPDRSAAKTGGSGIVRTLGFVSAGVGVAGMGVFAVFGLMANSRFSEIEDACGAPPCEDPSRDDDVRGGQTLDTVANVGLAVGIAGLVAGIPMIAFGGASEPAPASVALAPGPGSLGLGLRASY